MPGRSRTNFEKFWLQGIEHTEVLQHLHFHKSSAPPAGDQQDKLTRVRSQIQNMQEQMQGMKRKLDKGKGPRDWQGELPQREGEERCQGQRRQRREGR